MPSLLEPSLFDEHHSLLKEVFENLLHALGLGREQLENPSSLRSLAARLEGAAPAAQSMSLGFSHTSPARLSEPGVSRGRRGKGSFSSPDLLKFPG